MLIMNTLFKLYDYENTYYGNPCDESTIIKYYEDNKQLINANINFRHLKHYTLLDLASIHNHTKFVKLLIKAGADVTHHNPIHMVSMRGHTEVVKLLVNTGTDVNIVTVYDYTLLK